MTLGCYVEQFDIEKISLKEVEDLIQTGFWSGLCHSILHLSGVQSIYEYSEILNYQGVV